MIIFGLGNPGLKYRPTRHNAGFIFLNSLAKKYQKRFSHRPAYDYAQVNIGGKAIRLIKPLLYMNRSGTVVAEILKKQSEEFLVVLDDINLPLGKLRLRKKGSDGGHLGLRSIIESLNTSDFPRLRIGIGKRDIDAVDYVLSPFKPKEKRLLKRIIEQGIKGIEILVKKGFEPAQNFVNSINLDL